MYKLKLTSGKSKRIKQSKIAYLVGIAHGKFERSKTAELRAIQGAVKAHTKPRITTARLKRGKTKQDASKTRKARLPEGSVLAVHDQGKRSLTQYYAVYSLFYKTQKCDANTSF